MPRIYRIDLKYMGAPFQGWQSQPDGSGVQDHLEKALATMLRHPVRVTGASRTDTGVHAEHQVCTFRTEANFDEYKWIRSLQGLMPDSVGVCAIAPVETDFHPIYTAKAKAYLYRLWRGPSRHPLIAPYCWEVSPKIDVAAIRDELPSFVGTHDFSSFCAVDSSAKTKERTVLEMALYETGPLIEIWVIGHGFLKQMIRIMVGSLIAVGSGRQQPGYIAAALAARDRMAAGMTAPGQGLCLARIFYDEIEPITNLRQRAAEGCKFFVT